MNFVESVKTCLTKKYATFRGRASRSEYWYFYLFCAICSTALSVVGGVAGIVGIVLFVPSLAAGWRRLHDRNMSGWWLLAPCVLKVVGIIILFGGAVAQEGEAMAVGALLFVAGIVWLVVMMARKGTDGPNRFGMPEAFPEPDGYSDASSEGVSRDVLDDSFWNASQGTSRGTAWDTQSSPYSHTAPTVDSNAGMAAAAQDAVQPVAAPKFCSNCGAPISQGVRFCSNCGSQIG